MGKSRWLGMEKARPSDHRADSDSTHTTLSSFTRLKTRELPLMDDYLKWYPLEWTGQTWYAHSQGEEGDMMQRPFLIARVLLVIGFLIGPGLVMAETLEPPPSGAKTEQFGSPPSGQTNTSGPTTSGSTSGSTSTQPASGGTTTQSTGSTSTDSSSCGQPPLPPCTGQGVGELSPTTPSTTSGSSPSTPPSGTSSSPAPSSSQAPSTKSTSPSTVPAAAPIQPPEDASAVTKAIAAQTESTTSPLAALFTAGGQPRLLTLGSRTVRVLDLVGWTLVGLIAVATLLEAYFFVKQRRLWGVVYDARAKTPVELAVVRLFDQAKHKLLETRVTNRTGRYSFLADPGEYYLDATKEGFHFPSRIVTSATDGEYVNVYRGEVVRLKVGQSLVAVDIPIDSESGNVATASLYRRFVYPLLSAIRLPTLLVTLLTLVVYAVAILKPTPLIAFLGTMLGLLFIVEFIFIRRTQR